jgi:hypothetical protein
MPESPVCPGDFGPVEAADDERRMNIEAELDDMFGPEPEPKVQEPWTELMRRQFRGQGEDHEPE